jgi:class 3 adenylate cyclase
LDARALERDFDQIIAVSTEDHENRWVYTVAPSAADDPLFRQWWEATGRRGASPATARALLQVTVESDVRAALPAIQAPTLVVHLSDAMAGVQHGRHVADHIPHAQWVEIPGADTFWWFSDSNDMVLDQIEEFVTGEPATALTSRVLSTVLLIDIVSSTEHVATMGDVRWRGVLDRFDSAARRQLGRFRGTEVNTTGDGFVATFDGPARAVACACAIRDSAHQLGLEVRSGVHTGEIEQRGADIAGIAVHIAARVASLAAPSGVWVSRTVADLVVGSGIRFQPLGDHELKGVPGPWTLYAVSDEEPLPT